MLHLGIPVMDQHELTRGLLDSLDATVIDPESLHVVIVDNDSETPYSVEEMGVRPYRVSVIRNDVNEGYYWPLAQIDKDAGDADLLALIHNDMLIYEHGWDRRLRECFVRMGDLGMVGFCGSDEANADGGRGAGTMCFFRGEKGQSQAAGRRVTGLEPACLLDSLFICVRAIAIDALRIHFDIAPCHFYDKIWPMRMIEAGWKVGVLGVEVDHLGGMTAVANPRYELAARQWCERVGIDVDRDHQGNAGLAVYKVAEQRFLSEYRDQKRMLPGHMVGWNYRR